MPPNNAASTDLGVLRRLADVAVVPADAGLLVMSLSFLHWWL
ncbi:hypothetical protein SBI_02188 [Streptomyces bingchenggensis BCW-1]|uniref:Uncharacterized protein n=1 Tax=Streptomyces bingchenggensis (strain BCW-1) TaxID=749414 RepID=D7BT94_STRBB|nr:hypothetical protein SBI_02188 [Streptomyces bingchenggensis BCW-1]